MLKSNSSFIESGEKFASRRKELGLSLAKVAAALKIRSAYLKAIEDGDLKKIPSGMYASGYIRSYAKFLDLDITAVDKSDVEKKSEAEVVTRNLSLANQVVPGKALAFSSLLIIILVNLIYWLIYR